MKLTNPSIPLMGFVFATLWVGTLFADTNGAPIDFDVFKRKGDSYVCNTAQAPYNLCFEKSGFTPDEIEILSRSILQIFGVTKFEGSHLKACLESSPQKKESLRVAEQLTQFFNWGGGPNADFQDPSVQEKLPLIMLTRFREDLPKDSAYSDNLFYAYPGFVDSVRFTQKAYMSVGVSRRFSAKNPVIGANTPFWAGILTLAFLTNLGFSEEAKPVWNSPVHHVAQCIMYRGQVPSDHRMPAFRKGIL